MCRYNRERPFAETLQGLFFIMGCEDISSWIQGILKIDLHRYIYLRLFGICDYLDFNYKLQPFDVRWT